MKRFLSVALLWCLCFVANFARAAEVDDIIYDAAGVAYSITSLDPAEVEIASQTNNDGIIEGAVVVPSSFTYEDTEYSVTSTAAGAFNNTSITSLELSDGITTIPASWLVNCSALTSITFPSTLESIASNSIRTCTNLTTFTCYAVEPPTIGGAFRGLSITTIYVPVASVDAYKESDWATYFTDNILPIEDEEVTTIYVPFTGNSISYSAGTVYFQFNIPDDAAAVTISDIAELYSDKKCTTLAATGTYNDDDNPKTYTYAYTDVTPGEMYYGTLTADADGSISATYQPELAVGDIIYDENGVAYEVTSLDPATVSVVVQSDNGGKTEGDVVIPVAMTYTGTPSAYNGTEFTVTKIVKEAFYETDITSVDFEATEVVSMAEDIFSDCQSLVSVTFAEGCSLVASMFYGCKSLEYVDLPSTCTTIPRICFYLSNPTVFICRATTPPTLYTASGSYSFSTTSNSKYSLYVPAESLEDYEASDWVNYFGDIEPIGLTVRSSDPEADTDEALEFTKGEDVTITLEFSEYVTIDAGQSYINTYKALGYNTAIDSIAVTGYAYSDGCSRHWSVTVSAETISALVDGGSLPLVLYVTNHDGTLYNDDGYCMLAYNYSLVSDDITFTFDPEDGSTMDELGAITVSSEQGNVTYISDESEFTVYDEDGKDTGYTAWYDVEQDADGAIVMVVNDGSFDASEGTITESGTYVITFPAGTFAVDGVKYTEDITLTYTVEGTTEMFDLSFSPANGSTISELSTITILTDGYTDFDLGDAGWDDIWDLVIYDELGNAEAMLDTYSWDDDENIVLYFTFRDINASSITAAGTYTLDFEEGLFKADGALSNAVTLTYTIEGVADGISTVKAAISEGAEVYTISGQRVSTPVRGTVNIVKYADGSVKKMLVK